MAQLVTMYAKDGKTVKCFPVDVQELEESGYTKEPQAVKRSSGESAKPVSADVTPETQEKEEQEAPKRGRGRAKAE